MKKRTFFFSDYHSTISSAEAGAKHAYQQLQNNYFPFNGWMYGTKLILTATKQVDAPLDGQVDGQAEAYVDTYVRAVIDKFVRAVTCVVVNAHVYGVIDGID